MIIIKITTKITKEKERKKATAKPTAEKKNNKKCFPSISAVSILHTAVNPPLNP